MSKTDWERLPRAYFKLDMMIDALKDTRSDARYRFNNADTKEDADFFSLEVDYLNKAINSLEEAQDAIIEHEYQ